MAVTRQRRHTGQLAFQGAVPTASLRFLPAPGKRAEGSCSAPDAHTGAADVSGNDSASDPEEALTGMVRCWAIRATTCAGRLLMPDLRAGA